MTNKFIFVPEENVFYIFIDSTNKTIVDRKGFEIAQSATGCWRLLNGYVVTRIKSQTVRLHRLILPTSFRLDVDHRNGNPLDNRCCNLQAVTRQQNIQKAVTHSNSSSGIKGVSFRKDSNKWRADIRVNRKNINLGTYLTKEEATTAYNQAAKLHFGEFAFQNPLV